MMEHSPPAPTLAEYDRAIPEADLVRFFEAMSPHEDRCPVCGQTKWAYGTHGKQIAAVGLTEDRVPILPRMAMEAVWVRCRHCGYLRFHERATIEAWVAAHPKVGAS